MNLRQLCSSQTPERQSFYMNGRLSPIFIKNMFETLELDADDQRKQTICSRCFPARSPCCPLYWSFLNILLEGSQQVALHLIYCLKMTPPSFLHRPQKMVFDVRTRIWILFKYSDGSWTTSERRIPSTGLQLNLDQILHLLWKARPFWNRMLFRIGKREWSHAPSAFYYVVLSLKVSCQHRLHKCNRRCLLLRGA